MMRSLAPSIAFVLLAASVALSAKITLFQDTATFAERAQDIIVAKCDRGTSDAEGVGDGFYSVDVTVVSVLKGNIALGPMKLATLYPMHAGTRYALMSLGGSGAGISFFAAAELSVVEVSDAFDVSSLNGKPVEEQLRLVFAARKAGIDRQQEQLKREAALVAKALQKEASR